MSLSQPPSQTTSPASGERRAVRGLAAQYRVAAQLIYDAVIAGELDWIRLADPEAGSLDDIQIATPGRLDAYQVKWSGYEGRLTFASLLKSGERPSIVAQLADGWARLKDAHQDRTVRVHFLSREQASTDDQVRSDIAAGGGPRHFQAFLAHDFPDGAAREAEGDVGAPFARMRTASGLSQDAFARFLPSLQFDLGYRLERDASALKGRRDADLEAIAERLFELVSRPDGKVEFNRAELIAALGWTQRLDLRFRHEFPVDARAYRPIKATVRDLESALSQVESGYLALVGPPGSGKSTTLTQTLRYRPGYRFVRYYAFVRDDPTQGRGEAEAFLSDLTVALRRAGVAGTQTSHRLPQTVVELQALLGEQLTQLNADWTANGVKTVILVDGLDHIERELNPARALFDVLPQPDTVPAGVIFVLGTQKVGLDGLSARIRAQVDQGQRTLAMAALDPADVAAIVRQRVDVSVLDENGLKAVWRLSGGHPLSLAYLVDQLSHAGTPEAAAAILEAAPSFGADVTANYQVYWDGLKGDAEVRDLLGLICRLRGGVDLDLLRDLASGSVLERFVARAAHYFNKVRSDRWTFFHNSFRQFLIVETARDPFGRHDPDADRAFHRRLADAAAARDGTPFGWETLFHRQASGDAEGVLRAFTQDYFRQQFLLQRPWGEIQGDLALCMRTASEAGDAVAVLRGVLIEQELSERFDALRDADLNGLIVALAAPDLRAEAAIREGELRLSPEKSLDLAAETHAAGDLALARRLFDLAEPVDMLSGAQRVREGALTPLRAWAKTAWRFEPVEQVIALIGQVRVGAPKSKDGRDWPADDAPLQPVDPGSVHCRLLGSLGSALMKADQPTQSVEAALRAIGTNAARDALGRLEFARVKRALSADDAREAGLAAWRRVCAIWPARADDAATGAVLFTTGVRLGASAAEVAPYGAVQGPIEPADAEWGDRSLDAFWTVCEAATVLTVQSRAPDPVQVIADGGKARSQGLVLFNRIMVLLGVARGDAIAGRPWPATELVRRLTPAVRVFCRPWTETREWGEWHAIRALAPSYFDVLLKTAKLHGPDGFRAMIQAFETEWSRADNRPNYWLPEWRRAIALSAYALDGDRGRTLRWLSELEPAIGDQDELAERVEHQTAQIWAWRKLGELGRAREGLRALIADTFAIYHNEDEQFERWAGLARDALDGADAETTAAALGPMLAALPVLHKGSGSSTDEGARRLVAAAARFDPAWAGTLVDWLFDTGGASRDAALRGLLEGALDGSPDDETAAVAALGAARLLAPFEVSADAAFGRRLGQSLAGVKDAGLGAFALDRVKRATETVVFPHNRDVWRRDIARGLEASEALAKRWGASPDPAPDDKAPVFRLKSGAVSTLADVEDVPQGEPFVAFLATIAGSEHVDWRALLDAKLGDCGLERLRATWAALTTADPPFPAQAWFAERFAALGETSEAIAMAEEAYAPTKPNGWLHRWDDQARVRAAELLVAVSGDDGRRTILCRFTTDYLTEVRYPRDLLRWVGRIAGLLMGPDAPRRLWPEIAQHLGQLAQVQQSRAVDVPVPPSAPRGVLAEVLMGFAFGELDDPTTEVGDQARRFLVDMAVVPGGRERLAAEIATRLPETDAGRVESALALLECLAVSDASVVAPHVERLALITAETTSGAARLLAERLLGRIDATLPARPARDLPSLYAIHLPNPAQMGRSLNGGPERGESLRDSTDPMDLTRLIHRELALLAQETGIEFSVLIQRAAALMGQLTPVAEWDRAAEDVMRQRAESRGMKMAYRRLRSLATLRAFSHQLLELADADALEWLHPEFQAWLRPVDPVLNARDPSPRPVWLRYPDVKSIGHDETAWMKTPEAAFDLLDRVTDDGRVVLAELTTVERLENRRAVEVRASQLGETGFNWSKVETPDHRFFRSFPQGYLGDDYPQLSRTREALVARGGGALTPDFLALAPIVAKGQNWRPSDRGLFAWEDGSGELVVESLYWRDGYPTSNESRWRDELCGEGWLVLATPKAVDALGVAAAEQFLIASRNSEASDDSEPVVARAERSSRGTGPLRAPKSSSTLFGLCGPFKA